MQNPWNLDRESRSKPRHFHESEDSTSRTISALQSSWFQQKLTALIALKPSAINATAPYDAFNQQPFDMAQMHGILQSVKFVCE